MAKRLALISVSDKTGIVALAQKLTERGFAIVSTGGTAKALVSGGLASVVEVADITGATEMLGGRVKTLHPTVFGGILARRDVASDTADLKARGIEPVDIVVCNLYPFSATVSKEGVTHADAVENIDIGGVTLLRAAAKNHASVTVLCDPADYPCVATEVSEPQRRALALKAFEHTASYDDMISSYMRRSLAAELRPRALPLRYGMNPHQKPATVFAHGASLPFTVLSGSPGFINLCDALNAWCLVRELHAATGLAAATSFKHVSPAGAAVAVPLSDIEKTVVGVDDLKDLSPIAVAYARARGADRMSSFGDFVAVSERVDSTLARILSREVSDGIIAPGYDDDALATLKGKKGGAYVCMQMDTAWDPAKSGGASGIEGRERRTICGVTLDQPRNGQPVTADMFTASGGAALPSDTIRDLIVATVAVKYTQSNSVAYAARGQLVGLGAGQQSRIHCTRLAGDKADAWALRHSDRVLAMPFVAGTKRATKANTIDAFVTGQIGEPGTPVHNEWKAAVAGDPPAPLTAAERRDGIARYGTSMAGSGIVVSSDAFFPFPDNVYRMHASAVKVIAAPSGSQADEAVAAAASACWFSIVTVSSLHTCVCAYMCCPPLFRFPWHQDGLSLDAFVPSLKRAPH